MIILSCVKSFFKFQITYKCMKKYYIFLFFSFLLTHQFSSTIHPFVHTTLFLHISTYPRIFSSLLFPAPTSGFTPPISKRFQCTSHIRTSGDHFHPRVLFHPFPPLPGLHHPLVAHSTIERIHLRSRAITFLRLTQPFCSSAA